MQCKIVNTLTIVKFGRDNCLGLAKKKIPINCLSPVFRLLLTSYGPFGTGSQAGKN